MKQFKILIAIALLISSISVLVIMLFRTQPIQIILETGQAVVTKNPNYFTLSTVMILVIASAVIGASITYLFYNAEISSIFQRNVKSKDNANYDIIMPLLREDEKKAVRIIREHNGEILQNELVLKLGHSKVKTTRIIASLERKDIITKQRHGLTNHIKLKHFEK